MLNFLLRLVEPIQAWFATHNRPAFKLGFLRCTHGRIVPDSTLKKTLGYLSSIGDVGALMAMASTDKMAEMAYEGKYSCHASILAQSIMIVYVAHRLRLIPELDRDRVTSIANDLYKFMVASRRCEKCILYQKFSHPKDWMEAVQRNCVRKIRTSEDFLRAYA